MKNGIHFGIENNPGERTFEERQHVRGKLHLSCSHNRVIWNRRYRASSKLAETFILLAGMSTVFNSTLGTALTSGASPYLARYFNVINQTQLALPITCYLIGYVLGPIVFGPLSETYGRRPVLLSTFLLFTVFTLACALAPTYSALLVFNQREGDSSVHGLHNIRSHPWARHPWICLGVE